MADPNVPDGAKALDALAKRVAILRQEADTSGPQGGVDRNGMSLGLRLASEFASAILVGALLGYGVDVLVTSEPWGLLIGLALGFVTGTVNLIRASRQMSAAQNVDPRAPGPADNPDKDV